MSQDKARGLPNVACLCSKSAKITVYYILLPEILCGTAFKSVNRKLLVYECYKNMQPLLTNGDAMHHSTETEQMHCSNYQLISTYHLVN